MLKHIWTPTLLFSITLSLSLLSIFILSLLFTIDRVIDSNTLCGKLVKLKVFCNAIPFKRKKALVYKKSFYTIRRIYGQKEYTFSQGRYYHNKHMHTDLAMITFVVSSSYEWRCHHPLNEALFFQSFSNQTTKYLLSSSVCVYIWTKYIIIFCRWIFNTKPSPQPVLQTQ